MLTVPETAVVGQIPGEGVLHRIFGTFPALQQRIGHAVQLGGVSVISLLRPGDVGLFHLAPPVCNTDDLPLRSHFFEKIF